jgi:CarboxypepD_reg-like domain/TonB-dependent Receptor Plug Domain
VSLSRFLAVSIAVCIFLLKPALAQDASFRGRVIDSADGLPLHGVNVVLYAGDALYRGAVTDADGLFFLSRLTPGAYVVRVSFIGYETRRDTIALVGGQSLERNTILSPGGGALDEVLVEGERTAGVARITAGLQTIRAEELERVPSPDLSGDLASYLTTLPGVITSGDRGGQLFIRGGEPAHNLVLLDGMTIYQPFHILGFYSAFSADILQRADVYAGGYGSKYAGRVSSVMDISSRSGNLREHVRSFSVSPFVNALRIEGPLATDRLSFIASVRQSVIDRFASTYINQPLPYKFGDLFGKMHMKVSENHQLTVTALRTYDRGALDNVEAVGGDEVRWNNTAVGGRYLVTPRRSPVLAEFLFSISRYRIEAGPRNAPDRFSSLGNFNAGINLVAYVGKSDISYGSYLRTTTIDTELGGLYQNLSLKTARLPKLGFYLEPNIHLGGGWWIRPGGTVQFFDQFGFFAEPRFRALWQAGAHQVSFAAGRYHQELTGLNDRRDATNVFTAWADAPFGELTRATHAIAGYQVDVSRSVRLAAEAYLKDLENLYISEWTPLPRFTTSLQRADGLVRGADFRVEINRPVWSAYVTYGLASVTYDAQQEELALWFGSATINFRPPHDRRHQINALVQTEIAGFDVSVRWNFGSGLPYNQVQGFDAFLLLDGIVDVESEAGVRRVIYDRPYGGVLPAYHRLDVSVDRVIPFKGGTFTAQAGVLNAYDRTNLFSLDLFTLKQTNQLPIVPILGLKIEF